MLNICVDLPDGSPHNIPENLSFNEQESIVEIVLEQLLGCEDAIPEFDDDDSNQNSTLNNIAIDSFVLPILTSKFNNQLDVAKQENIAHSISYIPTHYLEIHLPPPEA